MAIDVNKILSRTPAEHSRFLGNRDQLFEILQVDDVFFASNPEGDLKLKERLAKKVPNEAEVVIDYKINIQPLNGEYVITQSGLALTPAEEKKVDKQDGDVNDIAVRRFLRYIDRMNDGELSRVFGHCKKRFGEIYKRIK
ncbi:hypothetical protein J4414_02390 [Candidatus Woesearchaeota archaeon]|nr:hypothetical protein [Candidatus Woesearchaeota archaeon]